MNAFFILAPPIITALLALRRLRWGAYAAIFFLPSYVVRTTIGQLPTTALELSLLALALVAAARLVFQPTSRAALTHVWRANPLRWPMIAFAAAGLIGVAVSPDLRTSLGAYRAWVLEAGLVGALVIMTIRSIGQAKDLILSLAVSGGLLSLYGLFEYFLAPSHLGDGRLDSVFVPANYHAMLTVPILLLVLPLISGWRRTWRGGVAIICILFMASALYFTFSFGGYLALAAGLLVMISTRASRKQRLIGFGLAVVLGAGVLATQLETFKLWNVFNLSGRSSTSVRVQIWHTSAELIREHPWFGVGYGDYEAAYRRVVPQLYWPPLEWLVTQPHDLYLALWTETGIFGLAAFIWLVVGAFRVLRGTFEGPTHPLALGAAAALIATLVHGLVDTPVFKNDLGPLFMMILASAVVIKRMSRQNSQNVIK